MELKVSFFHAALFMMMSKKAALEWNINQLVNQQAATLHSGAAYILCIAYYCRRGASSARAACRLKHGLFNRWTDIFILFWTA